MNSNRALSPPSRSSASSLDDRLAAFAVFCTEYVGLDLERFQRQIMRELFGGARELLVLIPRGNGKTTLMAAAGLFHALTTPDPAVYVAAASRDQARLTFEIARKMAARHPELDKRVTPRWNELRIGEGFLRVLSSDAPRAHGLAPTLALVDEIHAHKSDDLYVALKTALGKRDGAQLATISTAGHKLDSTLGRLRGKALALPNAQRVGTLTTASDPGSGFSMLEWAAQIDDDLEDAATVKAANPASFVTEAFLAEQMASPGLHPSEFARWHANVWTATEHAWLPIGAWQDRAANYTIEKGEPVWVGVDIGGSRAASAVVWATEDLRVGASIYNGDDSVLDVVTRIRQLADEFTVREIVYDPWRFQAPALDLERDGLPVVKFPQSNERMVPATERLYAAIVEGRLSHPGDPELDAHLAACVAKDTPRGLRIDKLKSRDQIDAAVALAMAVERAEAKPAPVELVGWL